MRVQKTELGHSVAWVCECGSEQTDIYELTVTPLCGDCGQERDWNTIFDHSGFWLDTCLVCKQVFPNTCTGDVGAVGEFELKDGEHTGWVAFICLDCMEKHKLSNCGYCGTITKASALGKNYECRYCDSRRAEEGW